MTIQIESVLETMKDELAILVKSHYDTGYYDGYTDGYNKGIRNSPMKEGGKADLKELEEPEKEGEQTK